MSNSEISKVLKSLYDNLVNEIDNQRGGSLDDSSQRLGDAVKAAVNEVYNEYCDPSDRIN